MIRIVSVFLGLAFAKKVYDEVKKIDEPKIGSIVCCELWVGEHTGIYIGDNKIVHLNGNGLIETVTPSQFIKRLDGWNNAMSIMISSKNEKAVGLKEVAKRAKKMIGERKDYTWYDENCHRFTNSCLNCKPNSSFSSVEKNMNNLLEADCWRMWDINL